jgi:citrate lyase beta subunit
MSDALQSHQRWVKAQRAAIQKAAQQGLLSVSLHDSARADDPAWTQRREILQRAGFSTELIAAEIGATLVVRW